MSTATVAERVRQARETRRPLRVRGRGTWMSAGAPAAADDVLALDGERGIVEYVAGDLTLTARAGTSLAAIAAATRANDQWLPLDPWGGDDGSLGATVSTATAGPHAHAMGLPRDAILGVEFVTGTGHVVRSGGRVVKNVAGFDLTRLVTGAWGTLGVITECTVRLRARPQVTRTVALSARVSRGELGDLATALRALPFTPMASELVNGTLATSLSLGAEPLLLLRLGGNARSIAAQLDALRALGDLRDAYEEVWSVLRAEPAGAPTWRWSQRPSLFGETWVAADLATREIGSVHLHGNPARGVVRIVVARGDADAARLARVAVNFRGTVVLECLPERAWSLLPPSRSEDALSRAVRAKFDPAEVLNRGILGAAR